MSVVVNTVFSEFSSSVIVSTSKLSLIGMGVVVWQSQLWGHSGQIQSHSSNNSNDLVELTSAISVVVKMVCSKFSSFVKLSISELFLTGMAVLVSQSQL